MRRARTKVLYRSATVETKQKSQQARGPSDKKQNQKLKLKYRRVKIKIKRKNGGAKWIRYLYCTNLNRPMAGKFPFQVYSPID